MIQRLSEVQAEMQNLFNFIFGQGKQKQITFQKKRKGKERKKKKHYYCLRTFRIDSSSTCDKTHQSTALPILGSAAAFLNYTAQRFCIRKGSWLHEIRGKGWAATSKRDKTRNHSPTTLCRNSTPQCSPATFNYVDDDQLERGKACCVNPPCCLANIHVSTVKAAHHSGIRRQMSNAACDDP